MSKLIKAEVSKLPTPKDYDLSEFCPSKVIANTSCTLLSLIANLVSNGEVTKKALTLTQSIQQYVSGTYNQTTLGLAVKLHHQFGSSELIRTLNSYGLISSYDKVLRFRKSATLFSSKNHDDYHKKLGLTSEIGPIFSWADNYDLFVSSPNSIKSTHALVSQFMQHPAGILETGNMGVMQLIIPRLKKGEANGLHLNEQSVPFEHYTGLQKINPPPLPPVALPPDQAEQVAESLKISTEKDVSWLSQLFTAEKPLDWSGYNAREDRRSEVTSKPKNVVVFGPLIDSPPAHPDTVLTTLTYLQKSLKSFGMTHVHITLDMQLYIIACLI